MTQNRSHFSRHNRSFCQKKDTFCMIMYDPKIQNQATNIFQQVLNIEMSDRRISRHFMLDTRGEESILDRM